MHVRVSRVRRGGKTFEYAQLVESYRRDDGMPAHRVLHSFGRVDETLLANLRAAFRGAKKGQRLEPAPRSLSLPRHVTRPRAALRYLDIAVVLEVFRQLGLDRLLAELAGHDGSEVPDHEIIAALVVQRCVAPDSKLAATRWFPTTALPELLAISPEQFNNTRLHRVLERLEDMTQELMRAVAGRCADAAGGFATLYMDITDTWFEGRGPELAAIGKTKEGMLRSKIGILLLCNEQGYPLRWEVLQGRYAEAPAMLDMLRELRHAAWLASVPVICDRAMGHTAYIESLVALGLQFLTALATPEMQSYLPQLDEFAQPLETLRVSSEEQLQDVAEEARRRLLQNTALVQVNDTLFVLDAGITPLHSWPQPVPRASPNGDAPGDALRAAIDATRAVESGQCSAYSDGFRLLGLDPKKTRNLRSLVSLPQDLQQRILAGEAAGLSAFRFAKIALLPDEQRQRMAFEAAVRSARRTRPTEVAQPPAQSSQSLPRVRVIVSFNPMVFASQRLTAQRHLESIRQTTSELNAQLARSRCSITRKGVESRIEEMLRRNDLLRAFQLDIKSVLIDGKDRFQVELTLDEPNWKQRRRTDGFSVFVAHPDIADDAQQLVLAYRAKDVVETDFRVIKSQVQLRPVRHRSDLKVRAHVTLCMLALLVERTLRQRLAKAGAPGTAESALALLEPVRLCHFPGNDGKDTYLPTQPSAEQSRLLRSLKLSRLLDPAQILASLTPRPSVVTTNEAESA